MWKQGLLPPKIFHFDVGTHQEILLCLHHYRIHLFDANEGQLALYSGVFHNTKPVMEPRQEEKRKTVICEISSEIVKLNSKENTLCHSIYRPIKPNTFEYIWKPGTHLTLVTSDEPLLEAILSVRSDNSSAAQLQIFEKHIQIYTICWPDQGNQHLKVCRIAQHAKNRDGELMLTCWENEWMKDLCSFFQSTDRQTEKLNCMRK